MSPPKARPSSSARRRGNSEGSTPRRRADGRWQINLRVTDDAGRASRHTVYGETAQEARERAAEIRKRVEGGLAARDSRETLAAFTQHWIDTTLQASERKPNTKQMYARIARHHVLASSLSPLTLDRLRPSHVEGWVVELRRKGLAESTVRSAYTILRAVLDTAVRDGALAANPAAAIRRPRVTVKEATYLTPAQVAELLRAAEGTRYAPLLALLAHTGLRRGEALALQWSDVDLPHGLLRVRGTLSRIDGALTVTEPKSARSKRVVPLSQQARRLLDDVRAAQDEERRLAGAAWQQTGFVFTTEWGTPVDPRNAFRSMQIAARRAGITDAGLHTLRHSAASEMLVRGVPLKVVADILGHSSISITGDIYGHVSPDVAREAIEMLGNAFGD